MKYQTQFAYRCLQVFVTLFFSCFLLSCTTKPNLETQALINLNNNLAQLTKWKLKGKIAWITEKERKSAYINWQQNDATLQFALTNVLGINLANLEYDGIMATLQADGKSYYDSSPSALIYQVSGWQVPLEQLSSWIKGAATSEGRNAIAGQVNGSRQAREKNQEITRYENGLIKQIKATCDQCDQWTINYTQYNNVSMNNIEYQLPEQINMFNSAYQATIKIRISEWSQ